MASTLPRSGPAREALRVKGQFWTPEWVSRAMVRWVVSNGSTTVYDPAVGAGAFFVAAKKIGKEQDRALNLGGREIDKGVLVEAEANGLTCTDLKEVELRDFVLDPPTHLLDSVVANPPYIRHHRLSIETKHYLRVMARQLLGIGIDGRTGYHTFFLIRALSLLAPGGRLAFILPADVFEGVSSGVLWNQISKRFRIHAVVTFDHAATPFPTVDTNPVVVFIEANVPASSLAWVRVHRPGESFEREVEAGFKGLGDGRVTVVERLTSEALATGMSRPRQKAIVSELPLGTVMRCMRGIATGENEFFSLTDSKVAELKLSHEFLIPVVARSRTVQGAVFTEEDLNGLRKKGAPTWLFAPDGRPLEDFPLAERLYLESGASRGVHQGSLIATRNPWYRMESRTPPPFLFAYLGRRNARFIRNEAGVVPLTGFLCVYPLPGVDENALWEVLQSDIVVENLSRVAKSYGSGAIKVEPRALERTPVPAEMLSWAPLNHKEPIQPKLDICAERRRSRYGQKTAD